MGGLAGEGGKDGLALDAVRDMAGEAGNTEKAVESLLGRARQAFRDSFLALTRNLEIGIG